MARINKNIKIPKGQNNEYDSVRNELITRLKGQKKPSYPYEKLNTKPTAASTNSKIPNMQNNAVAQNNNFTVNKSGSSTGMANTYNNSTVKNMPKNNTQNFRNNYSSPAKQDPYIKRSSISKNSNRQQYANQINNQQQNKYVNPNTNIQNLSNGVGNFASTQNDNQGLKNNVPGAPKVSQPGATFNYQNSAKPNVNNFNDGEDSLYSSDNNSAPMAGRTSATDDMATAVHSVETVKYKPKSKRSAGKTLIILLIMIAFIFAFSWLLREFVLQSYQISSGSMEKTLMTWDMVFAEKISPKMGKPKAGTIVTFDDPLISGRVLIKRVIATEGQVIDIKNNKLYIDGEEQDENYVNDLPTTKLSSSKINFPYTVPEHCVWVMGDNRTNSQDSRYFGAISEDSIIGRGMFVYWPLSNFKVLE